MVSLQRNQTRKELKRYGSSTVGDDPSKSYRKFAVGYSTERHFRIADDEEPQFYGAFGHVRKLLDHTHHVHYRKERQFVHDSIIEDYLEAVEEHEPEHAPETTISWLILTVGVKGAGKRHVINELVDAGHLPLTSYVLLDQDALRRCLPEYEWYLEHAPEIVGDMTRKEAGYIAETLCLAGLRMGKTVIWDCALTSTNLDFYVSRIQDLRKTFPCLKLAIMHVTAEPSAIADRRKKETSLTGRTIPASVSNEALDQIAVNVERIQKEVGFDFACRIQNDDDILEIEGDQQFHVFGPENSSCDSDRRSILSQDLPPDGARTSLRLSRDLLDSLELTSSRRNSKRQQRRRFSCLQSSEENHKSDEMNFYGRFAHIRRTLDYSYHRNYTAERQKLQDVIVVEFLKAAVIEDKDGEVCTTPTEPWLCFTAGPMGAGKSYTMRKLVEKGRFPLLAFVNVDPDEIRRQLPEYHLYVSQSPELAGELTRKEAGLIAEILTLAGLEAGKNVLVDGSLRDAEWYETYFKRLRRDFPVVRLAIIQVSAPREAVFQRASERGKKTGRVVPQKVLEEALEQVPRSVKRLAPLVDYHVELLNAPDADDIEIVTEGETWESFQSQWIQTCAWIPRKRSQNKGVLRHKESSFLSNSESASTSSSQD